MRALRIASLFVLLVCTLQPLTHAHDRSQEAAKAPVTRKAALVAELVRLRGRQDLARSMASRLRVLATAPAPDDLASADRAEWKRYGQFLVSCTHRIERLVVEWEATLSAFERTLAQTQSEQALDSVSRQAAQMAQSFNLQYLQLQQQLQRENRRFTAVSNILKTRHDAAKKAIENVR